MQVMTAAADGHTCEMADFHNWLQNSAMSLKLVDKMPLKHMLLVREQLINNAVTAE